MFWNNASKTKEKNRAVTLAHYKETQTVIFKQRVFNTIIQLKKAGCLSLAEQLHNDLLQLSQLVPLDDFKNGAGVGGSVYIRLKKGLYYVETE